MKRKKMWLRWIAWTLLLILCINSIGTTTLAADISFANAQNETKQGVQAEGEPVSEEESTEEGTTSGDEFVEVESEESTLEEESFPEGELSEEEPAEADIIPEEEITSGEFLERESIPQEENSLEQQEVREESPKLQEIAEGYDIDFYVIIDKEKVKLQHNDISGIATWKQGRTTYHGVSLADLLSVYEEFGFVKGSDGQNPDASKKFVSANRGNSRIAYGNVYTDSDTGKTYVSYKDGENKQGVAVDIYYLPNGMDTIHKINKAISKNTFYSVEVKGEGQDRIRYALTGSSVTETVSDFNPELTEKTDRIEWT